MFGGIVEAIGKVQAIEDNEGCKHVTIHPRPSFNELVIGESIAVNGVCLTVTQFDTDSFSVTIVPETLRCSNFGLLKEGAYVNLERSLTPHTRISGHSVQGHVDTTGEIIAIQPDASSAWLVKIAMPEKLAHYIVRKGYIAIDGMSITVIDTGLNWFTVTFIPHTQAVTITQYYQVGTKVNLEVDVVGKYIEKLVEAYHARP